jgi:branched-chain amino acid transport system substrate-binding protein
MKIDSTRLLLIGMVIACLGVSCTPRPRPGIAAFPKQRAAADELFQRAEKQYAAKSYAEALTLYNDYLERYPDEPLAPAALMKIGGIHSLLGSPVRARLAYTQLIAQYPSSSFRPEAMVEILYSLYRDKDYSEVVSRGPDALGMMSSPAQRFRTLAVIGDAYMALDSPLNAVGAYTRAMQMATASEQEAIAAKLKASILRLSPEDAKDLAGREDESLPMDYVLFQAGMLLAREGRQSEALVLLKAFLRRYPAHERAERAAQMVAEIEKAGPRERLTLGALLPLTGSYQAIGQRAVRGLELALSQYNSQGTGPAVDLIVKDTASDPEKTVQALLDLDREKVSAVIGPIVYAEAAAPEAQRLGLPMIAIVQKDNVVGIGNYVFRNFITPRAQMRSLVAYVVGKLAITRAVILYPDETYGRTFMGLFRDEFQARGGEILTALAYSPETVDFAASVKQLLRFAREVPKEPRPDRVPVKAGDARRRKTDEKDTELVFDFQAVFIPDEPKKAGMLVPQLSFNDVKDIQLLGTNLWHSEALIKYADPYVQGAIMPDAFFAGSTESSVVRFVTGFEEAYQEKPGFMEALAYDTAMILIETMRRPEVRFRGDIAAFLRASEGFAGVTGFSRFDASGDVEKTLHILQVRGKKFIELE